MLNRKSLIVFVLAVALFLIATNVQSGWLFVVVSGLIALLLVSGAAALWTVRRVEVKLVSSPEAFEGETVPMQVDVVNRGRWSRYLVKIESKFLAEPVAVAALRPGETARFVSQYRCARRGFYEEGSVTASSGAPFGLIVFKRVLHSPLNLTVYPAYAELSSFPVLEAASYPAEVLHERRSKGAGYDYLGVREWRPGDSMRMVHWRSSARRGRLVVKEFEEPAASTVAVFLDLERARYRGEGGTKLEHAIRVAASLASYVLNAGHPLQFFGQEDHRLETLFQPNFWQTLEWLAKATASGSMALSESLEHILPQLSPRSTCVIVTPSDGRDCLDQLALLQERRIRVVLIHVGRETPDLAESLLTRRVTVYNCREGDEIDRCLRRPLSFTGA